MSCDVIHRRSPAPPSSENHEREPERQVCSQFSLIMSRDKNVRKKLVNVNALLFRVTAPDVIPTRARGMTSARAIPQRRCKPVLNSPRDEAPPVFTQWWIVGDLFRMLAASQSPLGWKGNVWLTLKQNLGYNIHCMCRIRY